MIAARRPIRRLAVARGTGGVYVDRDNRRVQRFTAPGGFLSE